MTTRAVALLSGGLDSMLAIRILQDQDVQVEALHFQTVFTCCKSAAARAAQRLGVRLSVVEQKDDYLELVKRPRYGYGKGANPCIDCRIYMFQLARCFADEVGAPVVASGEVLGQRPKSQKRRHLAIIAQQSGLADRLLRPLSARLLPATFAERLGWIDRERLLGIAGRSRKRLIALARGYGFPEIPAPSSGCALTSTTFAPKVHDLVGLDPASRRWDFELLKVGRHLRIDASTKAIVGRREEENRLLEAMFSAPDARADALVAPHNFAGPSVLLVGPADEENLALAGGLVLRYGKSPDAEPPLGRVRTNDGERFMPLSRHALADAMATL